MAFASGWWLKTWALEAEGLITKSDSAACWLCDLGKVTSLSFSSLSCEMGMSRALSACEEDRMLGHSKYYARPLLALPASLAPGH